MEASDSSEVVDVFIVPNRFTSDSFSFCVLYTQHISDWFPTILAAAGITVDSLGLKYSLDGISHWDGITGRLQADDVYFGIRQDLYYGYDIAPLFENIGYRSGWMKILNGSGGYPMGRYRPPELNDQNISETDHLSQFPLYDLSIDPNELRDIAEDHDDLVQKLVDQMIALKKTEVPQTAGESGCPKQIYPEYPTVGKVYRPWCD